MRTFNLRLPDWLYEWLKSEADTDRRSMNAEIAWLLEQALAERKQP